MKNYTQDLINYFIEYNLLDDKISIPDAIYALVDMHKINPVKAFSIIKIISQSNNCRIDGDSKYIISFLEEPKNKCYKFKINGMIHLCTHIIISKRKKS